MGRATFVSEEDLAWDASVPRRSKLNLPEIDNGVGSEPSLSPLPLGTSRPFLADQSNRYTALRHGEAI